MNACLASVSRAFRTYFDLETYYCVSKYVAYLHFSKKIFMGNMKYPPQKKKPSPKPTNQKTTATSLDNFKSIKTFG